ncbi:hypothetical protein CTA1_8589 [Colletotrichum tanaceti]|uniref:Uncharacterized protein n=1 Tax=Colletotrichum tanaceti TaxID=1306861 RepID=A0A4U6XAN1_9PEZI|nr:hypothetical protein CTA1_8589 [Colletotrichum tanaceti]
MVVVDGSPDTAVIMVVTIHDESAAGRLHRLQLGQVVLQVPVIIRQERREGHHHDVGRVAEGELFQVDDGHVFLLQGVDRGRGLFELLLRRADVGVAVVQPLAARRVQGLEGDARDAGRPRADLDDLCVGRLEAEKPNDTAELFGRVWCVTAGGGGGGGLTLDLGYRVNHGNVLLPLKRGPERHLFALLGHGQLRVREALQVHRRPSLVGEDGGVGRHAPSPAPAPGLGLVHVDAAVGPHAEVLVAEDAEAGDEGGQQDGVEPPLLAVRLGHEVDLEHLVQQRRVGGVRRRVLKVVDGRRGLAPDRVRRDAVEPLERRLPVDAHRLDGLVPALGLDLARKLLLGLGAGHGGLVRLGAGADEAGAVADPVVAVVRHDLEVVPLALLLLVGGARGGRLRGPGQGPVLRDHAGVQLHLLLPGHRHARGDGHVADGVGVLAIGHLPHRLPGHGHVAGAREHDLAVDHVVHEPGHLLEVEHVPPRRLDVVALEHPGAQQHVPRVFPLLVAARVARLVHVRDVVVPGVRGRVRQDAALWYDGSHVHGGPLQKELAGQPQHRQVGVLAPVERRDVLARGGRLGDAPHNLVDGPLQRRVRADLDKEVAGVALDQRPHRRVEQHGLDKVAAPVAGPELVPRHLQPRHAGEVRDRRGPGAGEVRLQQLLVRTGEGLDPGRVERRLEVEHPGLDVRVAAHDLVDAVLDADGVARQGGAQLAVLAAHDDAGDQEGLDLPGAEADGGHGARGDGAVDQEPAAEVGDGHGGLGRDAAGGVGGGGLSAGMAGHGVRADAEAGEDVDQRDLDGRGARVGVPAPADPAGGVVERELLLQRPVRPVALGQRLEPDVEAGDGGPEDAVALDQPLAHAAPVDPLSREGQHEAARDGGSPLEAAGDLEDAAAAVLVGDGVGPAAQVVPVVAERVGEVVDVGRLPGEVLPVLVHLLLEGGHVAGGEQQQTPAGGGPDADARVGADGAGVVLELLPSLERLENDLGGSALGLYLKRKDEERISTIYKIKRLT